MEAAFFDLDKTVIARPSMVAFGGPLRRDGLVSRRLLLRAVWAQLIFLTLGADEQRLAKMRDAALRVSKGWEQRRITAVVRETLTEVIDPIIYDEAIELMEMHRAAGRKVFIVSASPEEVVAPLAQYLGADEAIATRAVLDDDGRYTGEVEFYCYGPEKAIIVERAARRDGIDLEASYAYSDSATDVPMLRAVGHAVAVNPDRELARIATAEGWDIVTFSNRVPMRERVSMPSATTMGVGGGMVGAAVAAGAGIWWWRRMDKTNRAAVVAALDDLADKATSLLADDWASRASSLAESIPGVRSGEPSWRRRIRGR